MNSNQWINADCMNQELLAVTNNEKHSSKDGKDGKEGKDDICALPDQGVWIR